MISGWMREEGHKRLKRMAPLCGAVILLALATPGVASADTLCVQPEASCTGPNTYPTVQAALDAANGNGAGVRDTVLLGAATYTENVTDVAGNEVDIVGAGTGQTTITAPTGFGTTVLSLGDHLSTITALTIQLPPSGNSNTGLQLAGDANGVAVTESSSNGYNFGVELAAPGATLSGSTVTMSSSGVAARSFTGATIRDSRLSGAGGFQGYGTIRRTRISSINSATILQGASTIENSILEALNGSGTFVGVSAYSAFASFSVELRNDTIVGGGGGGTLGVDINASGFFASPTVSAAVTNTIIRGTAIDLRAELSDPQPGTPTAQISIQSSVFDPAKTETFGGGQILPGAGNINADPLFTDLAGGDLSLTHNSPAVDRGDNGFVPSGPDLAGAQRVVDGDEDGDAIVDMGALEFSRATTITSLEAVAIPAVAEPGEPVAFIADASDSGDAPLTFGWSFDDGATGEGNVEIRTFNEPGTHTGTATVQNPSGAQRSATASVRIRGQETPVDPGTPAEQCDGRDATVVGTPGDDVLRGTARADVIVALGGDDKVKAGKGPDLVCGGDGDDKLAGDAGGDKLLGGGGDDRLIGGPGKDRLLGGPGKDRRTP